MLTRKRQVLVVVFVSALLLLNYPLLWLPERFIEGAFPWALLYLLLVWVIILVSIILLTAHKRGVP